MSNSAFSKAQIETPVTVANGGTGASTASDARTNLGVSIGTDVQAYDAGLASIAGLTTAADRMIYTTASDTYAVATLTSAARSILDDTSTGAIRTTLGVGTGQSPQFLGVNIGNATDTTLERVSAGVASIEGKRIVTKPENFLTKAYTLESPTSSEDLTLFFTDDAITVTQLNTVSVGTTPSVTYTIRHSTDRSATGNEVVTGGSTTTSTTTGDEVTSFDDATIPAGSWVWFETTATSGTIAHVNITIEYTVD